MCEALIWRSFTITTAVSLEKNYDLARVNALSEKLMDNPELGSLIDELSTSSDDASDLVKGLLQASIYAGSAGGDGCAFGLRLF